MFRKTRTYTIKGFLNNDPPIRVEGGVTTKDVLEIAFCTIASWDILCGTAHAGAITDAYNKKIFPLILDLGTPLAKTMMALGIYKAIRNDQENGWKMFYRAAIGLGCLFLIDGVIHIVQGVGQDLQSQ